MKKGSVTIFLSLVLVLVLSFIFSMLEGARVHCLKAKAQIVTELCTQSVFGNYHPGVWEDYHLLFLDGTWQEEEFSIEKVAQKIISEAFENLSVTEENGNGSSWDVTHLTARNMEIVEYELATDDAGSIFRRQVSLQMQKEAAVNVLDYLFQIKEQGKDIKEQQEQKENTWQQAWDAMGQAEELLQEQEQTLENTSNETDIEILQNISNDTDTQTLQNISNETDTEKLENIPNETDTEIQIENPMEYVKELKNAGVLTLVLEDSTQLSAKAVESGNFLLDRQLFTGTGIQKQSIDELERFWLQYYIENYFSNYVTCPQKGAQQKVLSYEIEYILAGKNSDKENLEQVVSRLLAVREIMNFTTLMQDAEKKSLALSIATATVGFTGILPLIKAVQAGILLAWAFVESVLDVRALLAGEKVPFLKKTHQWTSDLTNCRKSIGGSEKANKDENGWNYNRYLQMLLLLQSEENITYRCMDIIERNEQVQMDTMIQSIEGFVVYQASPLFWNFNILVQKGWREFSFAVETRFSYGN